MNSASQMLGTIQPLAGQTDLPGDQLIDRHAPRATTRYAAMP